jgi:hypothetical protein
MRPDARLIGANAEPRAQFELQYVVLGLFVASIHRLFVAVLRGLFRIQLLPFDSCLFHQTFQLETAVVLREGFLLSGLHMQCWT